MAATAYSLAIMAAAPAAMAQTSAQETAERQLSVPAGPLGQSILAVSRTFGVPVLAPNALVEGTQAPAVSGAMTAAEALGRLLAGSNLIARPTEEGGFVLVQQMPAREDDGPIRLAPITVTGERVERTVFDTPSSVVVVPGAEIEETPVFNEVDDILDFVPNIVTAGTPGNAPAIRGLDTTGELVGADAFLGGARPRATITLDGRPLSYNEFIYGQTSVWDLERVEVFRGPQTSAQGVNSIAGAVYVVTADPTFEPEVKAQGEIGNLERRRVSAAASGPIVADELAGRVAVDFQRRDSFVKFVETPEDGPDIQEFENIVARGKLLWEPAALPELSNKFTFSFTQTETPQSEFVTVPFRDLNPEPGAATFRTKAYSGIHDVSYAFSDNLEVSNRFSVTETEVDRFALPDNAGRANIDGHQFINEVALNWQLPNYDLRGLFGVYYQNDSTDEDIDLSAFLGVGEFEDTQTSLGLFGEVTYQLTDRLDVTAGLRYQRDNQDRDGNLGALTVDFDETFDALLPKFVVGYDVTDELRFGVLAVRGFNPGGTTIFFSDGEQDTFDAETVWNFELFGRARLFGDRLALDANAFYAIYDDYQSFAIRGFDPTGNPEFEIGNAERAISYGLELGANLQATDDLRVFGGLGLLNTEITDFPASADPNIEGNQFARAPHVTLSVGADYEVIDNLTLGGRLRYVSSYFSDDDNVSDRKAGDYVVADFQMRYALDNAEIYGFVNNAFDEFYVVTDAETLGIVGAPREYGVGLRVFF